MPDPVYMNIKAVGTLADAKRESAGDSKRALADAIDTTRPVVARALNHPSTRDLKTLARILDHYDVTVDTTPVFRVQQRTGEAPSGTPVTIQHTPDGIRIIPEET